MADAPIGRSPSRPVWTSPDALFVGRMEFTACYDYRDDPSGQRGAAGAMLWLVVEGPLAIMSCGINTGWMSQPLDGPFIRGGTQRRKNKPGLDSQLSNLYPNASNLSVHSREQLVDWWTDSPDCNWLGGDRCYGDTGYTAADPVFARLVAEGHEGAFSEMVDTYHAWVPAVEQNAHSPNVDGAP